MRKLAPASSSSGAQGSELPDEIRGQRRGRAEARPGAVDRDLLPGVAHLGAEMVAVDIDQSLHGHLPQPNEEGHLGLFQIVPQTLPGVQVGFLQHIGGVGPPS
ncbi:MAG: hypothetical protein GXX96_25935 [Planctomycetaceae bacterium]|nr:hypothetical protein [Planctomycetaceae bacterium]